MKSPNPNMNMKSIPFVFTWAFILSFGIFLSLEASILTDWSGLRTIIRRRANIKPDYSPRLYQFGPRCFDTQNQAALDILERVLTTEKLPSDSAKPDVCPIILSTAPRVQPNWIWAVSSLYQGFDFDSKIDISIPTVVWRRGAAFDTVVPPFQNEKMKKLIENGWLRSLLSTGAKYMPDEALFKHVLLPGSRWKNAAHFARQSLDHVVAMEDCLKRNCGCKDL
jgi:hypothetical protein